MIEGHSDLHGFVEGVIRVCSQQHYLHSTWNIQTPFEEFDITTVALTLKFPWQGPLKTGLDLINL